MRETHVTDLETAAEKMLRSLIGEQTTMGHVGGGPGPESNPNSWRPRYDVGDSYLSVLASLKEIVNAELDLAAHEVGNITAGAAHVRAELTDSEWQAYVRGRTDECLWAVNVIRTRKHL